MLQNRTKTAGMDGTMDGPVLTEAQLQSQIVELLQRAGWFAFVVSRPDRRTTAKKGLPDIWASRKSRAMWIEVKLPKGKLSPDQEQFRDECFRQGIEWHEARSVDDVMTIMRGATA